MQADLFGAYVRAELEHWGREFALHRDWEYLGHQSKNILAVLIEHRGEMPERLVGFKPLEVDPRAQVIENAVFEISKGSAIVGCALRAYYGGNGRRKVERYQSALELISKLPETEYAGTSPFSVDKYLRTVEIGTAMVRGVLIGMTNAA